MTFTEIAYWLILADRREIAGTFWAFDFSPDKDYAEAARLDASTPSFAMDGCQYPPKCSEIEAAAAEVTYKPTGKTQTI